MSRTSPQISSGVRSITVSTTKAREFAVIG
jgi:hypothetical protein